MTPAEIRAAIRERKHELKKQETLLKLEWKRLQDVECEHPRGSSDADGDFGCSDCGKGGY